MPILEKVAELKEKIILNSLTQGLKEVNPDQSKADN